MSFAHTLGPAFSSKKYDVQIEEKACETADWRENHIGRNRSL